MNILILLAVGAGGILALWLVQTVALWVVGAERVWALPLRHDSDSTVVRWTLKAALQCVLLSLLFLPPWLAGEAPLDYLAGRLAPIDWQIPVMAGVLTVTLFSAVLLFNWCIGWVKLEPTLRGSKLVSKLVRASLTPLPLAFMEELVFRGIVLEQLWRSFPSTPLGQGTALTLSALLFAAVHFLREQKRVMLPALGLFALGWMLGLMYLTAGHTIWLPMAFHAAGVWFIQLSRPFAAYHGPAWLIGYRSYPICGVFGLLVMTFLTGWMLRMM